MRLGLDQLPFIDQFHGINPMILSNPDNIQNENLDWVCGVQRNEFLCDENFDSDEDSEWEDAEDYGRNAFDFLNQVTKWIFSRKTLWIF